MSLISEYGQEVQFTVYMKKLNLQSLRQPLSYSSHNKDLRELLS